VRDCFCRKTFLITLLRSHDCQIVSNPAKNPVRIVKIKAVRVSRVRVKSLRCMDWVEGYRLKVAC
jgi:hypothetical protein